MDWLSFLVSTLLLSMHQGHEKVLPIEIIQRGVSEQNYKCTTALFPIVFANIQFNIIGRLIRQYDDRLQLECGILGPYPDTFRKLALNFHSSGINSLSHLCKYFLQDFLLAFKHHLWQLGLPKTLIFMWLKYHDSSFMIFSFLCYDIPGKIASVHCFNCLIAKGRLHMSFSRIS